MPNRHHSRPNRSWTPMPGRAEGEGVNAMRCLRGTRGCRT